jgi:hypothetical protein
VSEWVSSTHSAARLTNEDHEAVPHSHNNNTTSTPRNIHVKVSNVRRERIPMLIRRPLKFGQVAVARAHVLVLDLLPRLVDAEPVCCHGSVSLPLRCCCYVTIPTAVRCLKLYFGTGNDTCLPAPENLVRFARIPRKPAGGIRTNSNSGARAPPRPLGWQIRSGPIKRSKLMNWLTHSISPVINQYIHQYIHRQLTYDLQRPQPKEDTGQRTNERTHARTNASVAPLQVRAAG